MTYKTFGFGLALALAYGTADAETLTFDPSAGSERTYQVALSTHLGDRDGKASYDDAQQVWFLTRIRAEARNGDDVTLGLFPLWLKAKVGGESFSTAEPIPDRIREAMKAGFAAQVNLESGKVEDVTARGDTEVPPQMIDGMMQQFSASFTPTPIEVREGWSTTVPSYAGIPEVTISVTEVSDDSVFLRYEGDSDMARLTGLVVLDREEGWVERAVMTSDRRISPDEGDLGTLRETIALAPRDYPFPVHADYVLAPPEWGDMPETTTPLEPLPSEAEVFPHERGRIEDRFDRLELEFTHQTAFAENVGRFSISDPQFLVGDEALDIPLRAAMPWTIRNWQSEDGDPQISRSEFETTTLEDASRALLEATAVRADVAWYPVTPFELTLTPDETGHAEVTRDGATARLAPGEEGYVLTLFGKEEDVFSWALPEGSNAQGKIYARDRGPDWLTPVESLARRAASPNYSGVKVVLRMDEPPESVTVRVNRYASEAAATHEMRFLTERGKRLDPDTPPERRLLFRDTPPAALDEVAPEGLEAGALRFRLPTAQAGHCSARLDGAGTDHPLVFAERRPEGSGYHGTRLLELQTEDGVRRHFYEIGEQDVTLSCDATLSWTEAEVQPAAERPWEIDPAALEIPSDMTVWELMDQLRFVDKEGDALTLAAPGGGWLSIEDTVGQVTFPDGTLHVAGKPTAILRATPDAEPVTRRFTVTFPDLPVPEEAQQ